MLNFNLTWRLAFLSALISTLGSLYFSEVLHFPPCVLCWYQRICMYPLVVIIGAGLLNEDRNLARYVRPLALIGFAIAIYHNLLYYHVIPETISPCTRGVSCTTRFIEYFGFLTIPMLALIGFTVISILSFMPRAGHKEQSK